MIDSYRRSYVPPIEHPHVELRREGFALRSIPPFTAQSGDSSLPIIETVLEEYSSRRSGLISR